MRAAFVGPFTWFSNHFPEAWAEDAGVLCVDVDHGSYDNLRLLQNFRPELTVFYRPELYPRRLVEAVPGFRVAFLSEPLPRLVRGRLEQTEETELRLRVYAAMHWSAFHWRIFYDASRETSAALLGFPIDEFRPLPIDTSLFNPNGRPPPDWDVVFVGKPTPHRISVLDFLRVSKLRYLWIAHGYTGASLAALFRRARIVLNVHADSKPQFEPRIYLGAACGPLVVTEPLSAPPTHFRGRIAELSPPWSDRALRALLDEDTVALATSAFGADHTALSVRRLLADLAQHATGKGTLRVGA